jgi:hypothetical protein
MGERALRGNVAIFVPGMRCPLCHQPIARHQARRLFPPFVKDPQDALYVFHDATVHEDCYLGDPRFLVAEEAMALRNAEPISSLRPDRLVWRFRKSGASGAYTMPFDELAEDQKRIVLADTRMVAGEVPVLACVFGPGSWSVLTTRRLLSKRDGKVLDIPISDIVDATIDRGDILAARSKVDLQKLTLITGSGTTHVIQLEPGPPFFGFWNVMKTVAQVRNTNVKSNK